MKMYYLAYGSNLNVEQMRYRCPGAKVVGVGDIDGYRLLFKGSKTGSHLTIEKADGYSVPVGVWEINETHLKSLDRYEGFPTYYYRKEMPITMETVDGEKKVNAIVYIMHENRPYGVPSFSYVKTCADGYDAFGFDPERLVEAIQFSSEMKEVSA